MSNIVNSISEVSVNVALETVPGVRMIVSSTSSKASSSPVKVIDPVVEPAAIFISGDNW